MGRLAVGQERPRRLTKLRALLNTVFCQLPLLATVPWRAETPGTVASFVHEEPFHTFIVTSLLPRAPQ